MARELESDGDLEREHVDVWLKSLISRKLALEEEEKNRKKLQTAIYRVDSSLREVKEDHFDCNTLHLGLVSKIERPARVRESDTLKLDVVIKFLSDLGKHPDDWRSISKNVVPDPDAMKRIYNEYCRLSDDSIRSILAQDAIFLACFLIHFFRSLPSSTLRKTCDFFSRQSRRLRLVLLKDICKLENQIPLELVKNVIMIVFQCQKSNLSEDCQIKASETLEEICSRFVHTLGAKFPSSKFLTTQVAVIKAKQVEPTFRPVGEISTDTPAERTSTKAPVEETLSNVDAEKTSRNVAAQDNTRHNSEASSHHVIDVLASVEAKKTGRQSLFAIGRLLNFFSLSAYKETGPTGSARMTELLVSGPALTDIRAKASPYEETPPINSPIVSQAPEASSTRYLLDSRRHMTDGSAEEALGMDAQARETDHQCFIKCVFKQLRFPIFLRKNNPLLDPQASKTPATNTQTVQLHTCQHLLHCLAEVFWNEAKGSGSKELRQSQNLWDHRLPSTATELHKCGIELRGHKEFLPKFEGFSVRRMGATLYLPQIKVIDDDTEEVWRNLLAFEDAYMKQDERRSLMSSLQFMNDLINTEEDVQLLLTGKNPVIIKNGLENPKAVAQMFKSVLRNHFPACNAEWASIRREISAYYESMFRRGVAEFCHSINKWWLRLGLIAAVLVFIATFGTFIIKMVFELDRFV